MPYCLKCGSEIEDKMTFCPDCGTQLKDAEPTNAASFTPSPKQETPPPTEEHQKPAPPPKIKKHDRPDNGFIKYIVSGLILFTFGVSATIEITNPALGAGELLTITLLAIGIILILGAVYYALSGRKHLTASLSGEQTEKKPTPTIKSAKSFQRPNTW